MRALVVVTMLFAGCQCSRPIMAIELEPLDVPEAAAFPQTWLGSSSTVQIEVTNRGKTSRTATVIRIDAPFTTVESIDVPAGETAPLTIRFTPVIEGTAGGSLVLLDDALNVERTISLTATASRPPPCPSATACDEHHFDFARGECVKTLAADGTSCTSSFACFRTATCVAGECRGQAVTCDDGLRCTVDLCSELGCGSVSMLSFCPEPTNPCEASACTEAQGCTTEPLPDGTRCGERTCTSARVCISGQCVTRVPPKSQACADVLVGVPAGSGIDDGMGTDVRFEGASSIAMDGNTAYIAENGVIRRVTSRGEMTTILGQRLANPWVIVDGVGSNARFGNGPQLAQTGIPGKLLVLDMGSLRLIGTQGTVTTLVRAQGGRPVDGIGAAAVVGNARHLLPVSRGAVQFATLTCDDGQCWDGGVVALRSATVTGELRTLATVHIDAAAESVVSMPRANAVCVFRMDQTPPVSRWYFNSDGGLSAGGPGCPQREWLGFKLDQSHLWVNGTPLQWSPIRDGPIDDAGIGFVSGADLAASGALWFLDRTGESLGYDSTRVRVIENGFVRTIAGAIPERGLIDGPRDAGRLHLPAGLSLAGNELFFTDFDRSANGFVRVLSLTDLSLRSIGAPMKPLPPRDGPSDAGTFVSPRETALHAGGLYLRDESRWVRRVDLITNEITTVLRGTVVAQAWTSSWPWRSTEGAVWGRAGVGLAKIDLIDGGLSSVISDLLVGDFDVLRPGVFVVAAMDPVVGGVPTELFEFDTDGGTRLVAGRPEVEGRDFLPGLAGVARLGTIRHVRAAPNGAVYWTQYDENAINVLTPAGEVRRVIELADKPVDFVVEPSGTLLVAVASAILRVQP